MRKCIFNGTVVTPDELLPHHSVIIKEDRILSILPMDSLNSYDKRGEEILYFDARGGYIMPGFIDIHSDYIEGVIQPRPTSLMDFETGLREAEKQLLGHGITTVYHSLSLMNGSEVSEKYSFRKGENLERLVGLIQDFHNGYHLIRHRFHARYEIDNLDIFDYLKEMLESGLVHELSFMDHTPGQGQYRDIEIYAKSDVAPINLNGKSVDEILAESRNKPVASHSMLKRLASIARERGIPLASHDDDTLEKLALMKNEYGVRISEFPVEMEVARKARDEDMLVVMGAPNVMLGRSHSGNISAIDAIRGGCADILCSDYYPSSLLHSAFKLEAEHILTLPQAVRMLTLNPAKAMGIAEDFGSAEIGKKADILVVRKIQGCPMIYKCFIDGRTAMQIEYRVG
ncbi:MAG: alpha-D-ribose 1-methylphosphonate 5-triphosphate diphosphatase [Synergistaceae bacterium]|jgi:alpha-D-ribose 1-methylphosphonate 5-triphosphate diphosphatase|nr:alpha-D-ribose 1-methylphosphonate 5-triphosphate diphosphatase [Synergistaceae bacterium]